MEEGEADHQTRLDLAIQMLQRLADVLLDEDPDSDMLDLASRMRSIALDLRFFRMLLWGLTYWEESKYDCDLRSAIDTIRLKLSQTTEEFMSACGSIERRYRLVKLKELSGDLEERIKQFKPQSKEICILLLAGTFKCKSCQDNQDLFLEYGRETASFADFILGNLEALINSNFDLIAPVKQQIAFVQRKLEGFGRFADPVNHLITRVEILHELISCTRTWADHISCLACLYWTEGSDESLVSTMATFLSDLMHKTMPYSTPGVIASYLEHTMIPQLLASYFDFLLQDLVLPIKDDLCEGLIFLLSFVVDPPEDDSEDKELILAQIYTMINELPSLIHSVHFDAMKEGICEAELSGFLQKIEKVKAVIRQTYVMTPYSSSNFNSPRTNAVGFLDSLLRKLKKNLEEKVNFIPFEIIQKELASLRSFLQSIMQLQDEEMKDLRARIIDVVYYVTYVTNLCSARSFSVWYGIICLPNVIEDIKLIKKEIQEIENVNILDAEMKKSSNIGLAPSVTTSRKEGAVIGFTEAAGSIINHLMRGQKNLTIISISGMPGQGKTTLAKKIYNDREIQYYFHKIAWCYVSKECKVRELVVKIAHDLIGADVNLEFEDLVLYLWRSLKGKRYLIVMDDIWDVDVWRQVQRSFPDDNNGSRILFTTRNHDLVSEAKSNSISHRLSLLSEEESWELMKEKLHFAPNITAPQEFLEIAKRVVTYCKGLPLAVVLTAAILGRAEQKLDFWNEVAENLRSHLAREGCEKVIELSYKYLPDHLKPCFLYFGAFQRGESIRAKKLRLVWIAEGFIENNQEMQQSSEDLANGYLSHLISQSLVVVTERTSMGGIKRCNIHDLIYDFCLEKAAEENFLHWTESSIVIDQCYSSPQKYNHHRICIGRNDSLIKPSPIVIREELPTSLVHSLLWSFHGDNSWGPGYEFFCRILKSFKVVTVLNLEGVNLGFDEFPEVILSMIHLRYLALSSRSIDGIPRSIADLRNLETLIMTGWGLDAPLPLSFWKMKSLKHVQLPIVRLQLEDFAENNDSFAALHNIETLRGVVLVYGSKTQEFLKKLQRLRKLECGFDMDREYHPMWFSMFGSLKKLDSLQIIGDIESSFLHEKLPTFNFPENLQKLTLFGLKLPWSVMSTIGKQLPNLEVLKVRQSGCLGPRWDLEDGDYFSRLRYLKLELLDIEEIDVSGCGGDAFPCLEELVVDQCKALEEIPSSFGGICTLNKIMVLGCSQGAATSAMEILKEQRELDNRSLHVFVREGYEFDAYELELPETA